MLRMPYTITMAQHRLGATSLLLCRVYELYNNFVLKNPFYEMEMPVRCELFDTNLIATVAMLHRRWGVMTQ
jgi:trafficking protein particle complex subunit 4